MDVEQFKRREQLQRIPAMGCALFRTTVALQSHAQQVPSDRLVMLHDHRPDELPFLQLPDENIENRWQFAEETFAAEEANFLEGLIPLPDEGLYILTDDVVLSEDPDDLLLSRTLVMVGYDVRGCCVLFPARAEGLAITFPDRGYHFESPEIFGNLEAVGFDVVEPPTSRAIH